MKLSPKEIWAIVGICNANTKVSPHDLLKMGLSTEMIVALVKNDGNADGLAVLEKLASMLEINIEDFPVQRNIRADEIKTAIQENFLGKDIDFL